MEIVKSKFKNKYWVKDSKGRRVTSKFELRDKIRTTGPFTRFTIEGYNEYLIVGDELMKIDKFRKISDNLYHVSSKGEDGNIQSDVLYDQNGLVVLGGVKYCSMVKEDLYIFMSIEHGKCGIINDKGEWVLEPKYASIQPFNNRPYTVAYEDCNSQFVVIDVNGEVKSKKIDCDGLIILRSNVLRVQRGKLYGLINMQGEEIVPCKYHEIELCDSGYYSLRYNTLYGFADPKGKIVVDCIYKDIEESPDGFVVYDKQTSFEVISKKDR